MPMTDPRTPKATILRRATTCMPKSSNLMTQPNSSTAPNTNSAPVTDIHGSALPKSDKSHASQPLLVTNIKHETQTANYALAHISIRQNCAAPARVRATAVGAQRNATEGTKWAQELSQGIDKAHNLALEIFKPRSHTIFVAKNVL